MRKQVKETVPFVKSYGVNNTPNKDNCINIIDTLVYAFIYSHLNKKTGRCNPKMETLAEEVGLSKHTIFKSIKRLEKSNLIFITQTKQGNKVNNTYQLPDYSDFAMIPKDFLYVNNYDPKYKAFIIAFRNLCFNDTFKCKYNNDEIVEMLGVSSKTFNKYITAMKKDNIVKLDNRHSQYLLNTETINWRLSKIESDLIEVKSEVELLKEQLEAQQKQIDKLLSL